ncbi:MAG: DNA polymerase subunit beta [Candidatus Magnetoglobus multicellularis str. Araruama]|uniref:DNA polymerase subunit beta n=1 Tax=Candidatus Magnetoglobus multicellularis str. Araruama TaxID=890399 RepID=A0A1V1P0N2_9BACT|nr:MAG: DNA polymerase subunit beta [Candidatus Magnetoglobus multicellularis str. Araruama]
MKQNDPFYIWKKHLVKEKQLAEIKRKEMFKKVCHSIEILSHKYDWNMLYIFGSLVKEGAFTNRSDIDIAISGLNKFEHYRFIADISGLIERDVDVVLLEDLDYSQTLIKGGIQWKKSS